MSSSMSRASRRTFAVLAAAAFTSAAGEAGAVDVLTRSYDNARTGGNPQETTLTTANVRPGSFARIFSRTVNGHIYAQPLYLGGIAMGGKTRNVVIVATMKNVVYAFDADDPFAATPIWTQSYEAAIPLPNGEVGQACGNYRDIAVSLGILSTPVIDRAAGTMYFVVATRDPSTTAYIHWLHAVDVTSGAERPGSPVAIAPQATGTGDGADAGTIAFNSRYQIQRAGLLLANGNVYVGFAGYCDSRPYHGWLVAYHASDLGFVGAFNSTPNGWGGGLWQAGQAPAADDTGNVYACFADGTSTKHTGGTDHGNFVVRFSPTLDVLDWFAPHDVINLDTTDFGFGSTGVSLLPELPLAMLGSKQGVAYVLDRTSLGGFDPMTDHVVDTFDVTPVNGLASMSGFYGTPVYWKGPAGGRVYAWGVLGNLLAYQVAAGTVTPTPVQTGTLASAGRPGGILTVSSNGDAAGSGIVWASMGKSGDANQQVVDGVLRAFDANDVGVELWNSEGVPGDTVGKLAKFAPPTVAGGHVYLATFSGLLDVYGLTGLAPQLPDGGIDGGADGGSSGTDGGTGSGDAGTTGGDSGAGGDFDAAILDATLDACPPTPAPVVIHDCGCRVVGGDGGAVAGAVTFAGAALLASRRRRRRAR